MPCADCFPPVLLCLCAGMSESPEHTERERGLLCDPQQRSDLRPIADRATVSLSHVVLGADLCLTRVLGAVFTYLAFGCFMHSRRHSYDYDKYSSYGYGSYGGCVTVLGFDRRALVDLSVVLEAG